MDFKLLGSILLIVGTSIGAGMLALPIATAQVGFIGSVMLLIVCWFMMTSGAFLLLEVTLWLPQQSNLISMAKATLGPYGQMLSWVTFLLLLYSLLCAYIAGGSDLLQHLLFARYPELPKGISAFLFTLIFGSVVYLGIRSVDYVNRGLMLLKFSAYFFLILLLMPFVSVDHLAMGNVTEMTSATAITVTISSFGFATIVPSLRIYFSGDIKKLKKAIFIGSLIPLVCYIIWDAIIMGVIPLDGSRGLLSIFHSGNSTSELVGSLTEIGGKGSITFFVKLFTSICVLTSFLGVALCLVDFLADGLQLEKKGMNAILIHGLAFIPPLIIVLFYPKAFIQALEYAGIYSIILLVLLPAWMSWRGRYHKHIVKEFKVFGGRILLFILILFSILVILRSIFSMLNL